MTPLASGLPYFYVRGAAPNNAGYFVDGVRVPLLFHLEVGQSVIHPGLVNHVDFFPSAAPAQYGGYAGAIIAGQTREPATAFHGEANLRVVDAGSLLEAPFADGRGSALVAGRYGYPGAILALATDDIKIGYWDYQARSSWKFGARDTIGVFAFGSHDYLASRSPSGDPQAQKELREQFVSDFHRVDLRYDHTMSEGRLRFALTGGYDRQGARPNYVKNKSLGARFEAEQKLSETVRFRGGASAEPTITRSRSPRRDRANRWCQNANPPPTNLSAGLRADFVWRITPRVESCRARASICMARLPNQTPRHPAHDDHFASHRSAALGPRDHSARRRLADGLGVSHQYPSLRFGDVPAPLISVPGFPFGDRQLQSAMQGSEGFEVALPADLVLTATGFYSYFWGLTDLSASCFQLEPATRPAPTPGTIVVPPYVCANNQPVRGRAYGLELLLRRSFSKRLSGWLSYTLSRATREAHFITPVGTEDLAHVPASLIARTC